MTQRLGRCRLSCIIPVLNEARICLLRKMCRKGIEMDKITIMVVDDSPFASKQIQDVVEENGYEVVAYAANGD